MVGKEDFERTQLEQRLAELLRREQVERVRAEQALSVLRHTEQRFGALFESNVIGIIEINHERVLDANESFLEMIGQTRSSVLEGKLFWRDLTPTNYREMDDLAHERAIRDGSFAPFEKEMYRKDGALIPVWVGGVLLNAGPNWTCMSFVLDLTERKALEAQFHSAQKLKSLGLLSSVIAHDFNNLLTTIIGNASLALDALNSDHSAYGPLQEVLRASQIASGLTSQLVGYSAKPRTPASSVDLSKLVREIGELIELPLSRNVQIEWNLASGLPYINGDSYLIQQILMNLVINASDATGGKAGVIRIVTHCREYQASDLQNMTMGANLPAGEYVAVEVHDDGCGMTDEVKAKIFDALFTTKMKGRGLGLAATLGIVRSHRGAIDVHSVPGQGTRFIVLFPATKEGPQKAQTAMPDNQLRGQGTVLVVDDEPSVRRLAEATLTRYGYEVILASDGKEGVEIYKKKSDCITLIIMDVSMPTMNGQEALQHLKAAGEPPPVLFSSGFNTPEAMQNLEQYPFLQKPYTSRELAERVKQLHTR